MSKARIALMVALLLFAVSTELDQERDPYLKLPTPAYEFASGTSGRWCDADDSAWMRGTEAFLVGPHFAASVKCRFVGESVPAVVSGQALALEDEPPAAMGNEFVLTQFAVATFEPPDDAAEPIDVLVRVGEREFPLDEVPGEGDWIAVVAPLDEQAALWIEEDGRAQGLDLRTGDRIDDAAAYYEGIPRWTGQQLAPLEYEVDIDYGPYGWWISCESGPVRVFRDPWVDGLGWAPEGSVFLRVTFGWCKRWEDAGLTWELDPDRAVEVEGAEKPVSWEATENTWDGVDVVAVYAIPEDASGADIGITPHGELTDEHGDPVEILDELETTEMRAEF